MLFFGDLQSDVSRLLFMPAFFPTRSLEPCDQRRLRDLADEGYRWPTRMGLRKRPGSETCKQARDYQTGHFRDPPNNAASNRREGYDNRAAFSTRLHPDPLRHLFLFRVNAAIVSTLGRAAEMRVHWTLPTPLPGTNIHPWSKPLSARLSTPGFPYHRQFHNSAYATFASSVRLMMRHVSQLDWIICFAQTSS